jgi:hypothetical protein
MKYLNQHVATGCEDYFWIEENNQFCFHLPVSSNPILYLNQAIKLHGQPGKFSFDKHC